MCSTCVCLSVFRQTATSHVHVGEEYIRFSSDMHKHARPGNFSNLVQLDSEIHSSDDRTHVNRQTFKSSSLSNEQVMEVHA